MTTVEIGALIERCGMNRTQIGEVLFPGAVRPDMAVTRIIKGEQELTVTQLQKLTELAGVPIQDAFERSKWKAVSREGKYTLSSGDWRAEVDLVTWVSRVYNKDNLVKEELLLNPAISVNQYINTINQLIKSHESND